jgi:hypothetical protein
MDRTEHGRARAGKIGASVANIIDRGGKAAWDTLAKNLWADETGEAFAAKVTGAREYGHEHEAEGAAKFWVRHPEIELVDNVGWIPYVGPDPLLAAYIGCSPDRLLRRYDKPVGGLEVKSPVTAEAIVNHTAHHHRAQCGHSMLATDAPWWWLVAHHGDNYVETRIRRNYVWEKQYIRKLHAFLTLLNDGKHVRRRMRASDLDNL